ncbi:pentatricopeptide repeat-containing protein At3g56030, mitochondrial-like [Tasmannia lanceolata]|uniref:pentatricopeptide repeat-containing protein At3g56030, mitochondrial-like n=1 Tax=Tasmannia lanceolata TaxID=3420 RepID=UPI004062D1F1
MGLVQETLTLMKTKTSFLPDVTCYNYILSAYCHTGNVVAAAEVLGLMEKGGLELNSLSFDAMVLGACRVGRIDGAIGLLRRMEEDGVKVLYCTYGHIINGLLGLGCFELAVEFVRVLSGRNGALDGENFGLLARVLVRKKRWEEARLVLEEMEERGLEFQEKVRGESNVLSVSCLLNQISPSKSK